MMMSSNVRGIHRGISLHKGQWRGALMFPLICVWTNSWATTGDGGDLRRHRTHYDVTVMLVNPMGAIAAISRTLAVITWTTYQVLYHLAWSMQPIWRSGISCFITDTRVRITWQGCEVPRTVFPAMTVWRHVLLYYMFLRVLLVRFSSHWAWMVQGKVRRPHVPRTLHDLKVVLPDIGSPFY